MPRLLPSLYNAAEEGGGVNFVRSGRVCGLRRPAAGGFLFLLFLPRRISFRKLKKFSEIPRSSFPSGKAEVSAFPSGNQAIIPPQYVSPSPPHAAVQS